MPQWNLIVTVEGYSRPSPDRRTTSAEVTCARKRKQRQRCHRRKRRDRRGHAYRLRNLQARFPRTLRRGGLRPCSNRRRAHHPRARGPHQGVGRGVARPREIRLRTNGLRKPGLHRRELRAAEGRRRLRHLAALHGAARNRGRWLARLPLRNQPRCCRFLWLSHRSARRRRTGLHNGFGHRDEDVYKRQARPYSGTRLGGHTDPRTGLSPAAAGLPMPFRFRVAL